MNKKLLAKAGGFGDQPQPFWRASFSGPGDQIQSGWWIWQPCSVRAAADCACAKLQWGSKRLTGAGLLLQQALKALTQPPLCI